MLAKVNFTKTKAYKALGSHFAHLSQQPIKDLFALDPYRFEQFSIHFEDILLDYSKNRINEQTLDLLCQLAEECQLSTAITALFSGEKINETENRSVLHSALRNQSHIMPKIQSVLQKMAHFSQAIIAGHWQGYSGKAITDVVNIGIGGSDLGPLMVTEALKAYSNHLKLHFVSNIDGTQLAEVLKQVHPETTIFLIASKTFTTHETMVNASTARDWFMSYSNDRLGMRKHFVALSANAAQAAAFGIDNNNLFEFWDWVGGRYSLWGAIGLSISLAIGFDHFKELLSGAYAMDKHFQECNFKQNMPVILALLGIWYNNFFNAQTHAILPYDQYMHRFPAYLQQVAMESNGKQVARNGEPVTYQTGEIIWGAPGTNGQHAFYQLMHQGTKLIPCDFIVPAQTHNKLGAHHVLLLAHCFAQTEALMRGKSEQEVYEELQHAGHTMAAINKLAPYQTFPGNHPSNTILVKKITPRTLGSLLALYEHKIFTQGVIWNIFSFDQWGVELGKQLAKKIHPELESDRKIDTHDASTNGLINQYKAWRD